MPLGLKGTGALCQFSPSPNLLRQRKKPDRLCMRNTPRILTFFTSLQFTIFENPAYFDFFEPKLSQFRA
jgi:hypothetical protein